MEFYRVKALKLFWMDYARMVIPSFSIDKNNQQVISDLFNYFIGQPGTLDLEKGLWLEGDIGTGKSSLMQIFSKFMIGQGNGFLIHICSSIVNEYSLHGGLDTYTYNKSGYSGKPSMMCFDELGREPMPATYFGQKINVMQYILHVRYSLWQTTKLRTFVTTNLDSLAVEELYGDFIRDRRKEMFNIVTIAGKSRR